MIINNHYSTPIVVADQNFNDATKQFFSDYNDKVSNQFFNDYQSKIINQDMMNIMMRQFMDKMYDDDCPYNIKADHEW